MSRENVELVRAAIAMYNRGDWDAVLKRATPDFEFDFSRAVGPLHGVFRLDQVRAFWDEYGEAWESVRLQAEEMTEVGNDVVVPITAHTRGRDGIEVTSRPTYLFTIRDGAIARVCMYQDRDEALDAVGLEQ